MAPESMVAGEKVRQERAGRMRRGLEEAGESRSTLAPGTPGLLLTMDDILKLPKHDLVTQFKCIEGWSQIVHWSGVRLADLIAAYPPEKGADGRLPRYVYMETPNGDYYVGYDLRVCLHPQALLVTEMGGSALTQYHGAPLRLHAPMKYGYKQIKRIGLIAYTDQQPDDYWTKLGYDWYAGL
jgi:DMSO/TMAO reductase YedYZ molybdopterin-dependent catalytic subunit